MYPTLLDVKTGETAIAYKMDSSLFWWADGNGSCDCNRAHAFSDELHDELERKHGEHCCFGSERLIVIDVHGDLEGISKEDVIAKMNSSYDLKLWENV